MPSPDQRPKVTLEDLLQLKRAERPAPEFWATFDTEMRQKQLAALLEKRSWWQELPQLLVRHAYLPVGATAVLAFTLVSVKYYSPSQLSRVESIAANKTPAVVNRAVPTSVPTASMGGQVLPTREAPPQDMSSAVADEPVEVANDSTAAVVKEDATLGRPAEMMESPSSRYIANNLDRLERTDPELVQSVLGSRLSAPARAQTASLPFNELASVPTGTTRRSRLLAQYTDHPLTPEPTAPEIVRERLARRLGDSELSDRISRIGLKGDQVSLGVTLRL